MKKAEVTRREFLKGAAYVAPLVTTMSIYPSFASAASGNNRDKDKNGNNGNHYGQN